MHPRWVIERFREEYHYGRYGKICRWIPKKCLLLDIGCGRPCPSMQDGAFINYLGFGTGLDLEKYSGLDCVEGNVNKIPFEDEKFDTVTALEILEHVDDIDGALSEIRRVLKDNGILIISTPKNNIVWKIVWYIWEKTFGRMWKHTHKQTLSKEDWLKQFEKHFKVVDVRDHWNLVFIAKMRKG